MAPGSSVVSVEAYDLDLGRNGHLYFDILAADVSVMKCYLLLDSLLSQYKCRHVMHTQHVDKVASHFNFEILNKIQIILSLL